MTKLKVCLIWSLKVSWFPFKIFMLYLIAFISSVLLVVPNRKLNSECIILHLVQLCFNGSRVLNMLLNCEYNFMIWHLQLFTSWEHEVKRDA